MYANPLSLLHLVFSLTTLLAIHAKISTQIL